MPYSWANMEDATAHGVAMLIIKTLAISLFTRNIDINAIVMSGMTKRRSRQTKYTERSFMMSSRLLCAR